MEYQVVESSAKAQSRIVSRDDLVGITRSESPNAKYPFGDLGIGMSFAVPFDEIAETSLRNCVSMATKRYKPKRFAVVKHSEVSKYEVARIA